jgi:hypothetical protein
MRSLNADVNVSCPIPSAPIHPLLVVDAQLVVGENLEQKCSELIEVQALQVGRRKAHCSGHVPQLAL